MCDIYRPAISCGLQQENKVKFISTMVIAACALAGCISSSSPPEPAKNTTVVVPPNNGTTVVCQDGSRPPC